MCERRDYLGLLPNREKIVNAVVTSVAYKGQYVTVAVGECQLKGSNWISGDLNILRYLYSQPYMHSSHINCSRTTYQYDFETVFFGLYRVTCLGSRSSNDRPRVSTCGILIAM